MTPQPSEQPRRYSVTRQTLASALHGLTVGRGGLATCYHAAEGSECSYTAARILQELAHEAAAPDPVATPPKYGGLIATMDNAVAQGLTVHVATRATCAEHFEHGDDRATEPLTAAAFGLDVELLARAMGPYNEHNMTTVHRAEVPAIAAEYARLGQPVAEEPRPDPEGTP